MRYTADDALNDLGRKAGAIYDSNGLIKLLGRVLEGMPPDYYRGPCGRFWATVAGFNPDYLFAKSVKGTTREGEKYSPSDRCPEHKQKKTKSRM